MKNILLKGSLAVLAILGIVYMSSCSDQWEEHYDESTFDLSDETIMDIINGREDLSTFAGILTELGYDSVLSQSQSYTVWAPTNEALSGMDLSDADEVEQILKNHIARSKFTTSSSDETLVPMLNGKNVSFTNDGGTYSFSGEVLTASNLVAKNGLLHVISGYATPLYNIYEFLKYTSGLDSVKKYIITDNDEETFDASSSTEVGINEDGQVIYDSTLIYTNEVLEVIGSIYLEDSVYTAFIPNNDAWNKSYTHISEYYNFPPQYGGEERQREVTRYKMVKDMLFREEVEEPANYDSLVTTTRTVVKNLSSIFGYSEKNDLSNGIAYVTDSITYPDTLSFFKEIRVEAENDNYYDFSNFYLTEKTSYGSGLDISDKSYVYLEPTGTNDNTTSSITFSIPNTLSGTYQMYCVFVPNNIENESDTVKSKAKFVLTYIRAASESSTRTSRKTLSPEIDETNTTGITKLDLGQFEFDYANVVSEDYPNTLVKLEVSNKVTVAEEQTGVYTRDMRIDCVIFEPVTE